ncbi:ribosome small subunit-dependent GTPase A [uncultured Enterococcus sp.]|uniref:ribosome small subunit-dependent GTPase A n=1 Tax=uncultured Enterococcus sp. TaxID=167972 RepID=UPI0028F0B365|nr:ribosome small subunit-dependent GTPase A [uncultured Enterococcus sp.]
MEKQGIVVFQAKDIAKVRLTTGEECLATVSGKFRQQARAPKDDPIVGDFVQGQVYDQDHFLIDALLPRKSFLQRKVAGNRTDEQGIAANIDTVFIATSANEEFNLARLERFVTIAWDSGANPVILLTKADQVTADKKAELLQALNDAFGVKTFATSIFEPNELLMETYFSDGQISAFIGSSGVGKSSLLNQLMAQDVQKTNDIREDSRGRHTTTSRQLFTLSSGAMIIDTPGMREVGISTVRSASIDQSFEAISQYAEGCFFRDCRHETEPKCAVKAAIAAGELSEEAFARYRKMEKELAYLKRKEQIKELKK